MINILILNPLFILKRSPFLKWKIILRVFWILSIFSILAFLVFYVFQANAQVSERYLIQKYEKRLSEFSKENKSLGINSVQLNSLNNITTLINELGFEKIDKIHYIRVLDGQVVTK